MKKLSATQVNAWRLSPDRIGCRSLLALVSALAMLTWTFSAHAQVLATAQLNIERRGHTATLLDDGKVLIVGGDNYSGMIGQSELFDPASQSVSLSAASIAARTDHTATKLLDGRVIIVGGQGQNGSLTSTEIYNPLTSSLTAGPSLTTPRSGHTATVLADGKILIAGGDASGSAEIYDPVTQNFSLVTGSMQSARKFHSAILTSSGQVLIVGGVNAQNSMLNTAEVYDASSQSFYTPPTDMQTQRALATLKLLPDGKVQIIGGDAELSMEVFDPVTGIFNAKALLPPNANLLGATLSTQSRAALFSPSILQDPLLQGVLTPDASALLDRADHSITELPAYNQTLVTGGINSAGQILKSTHLVKSSSASVTTDKTDYPPGEIVTITGNGFQPNEQVQLSLHEFPEEYPDITFSALANQQGNFVATDFAPQVIDLDRTFTLTAIGQSSGRTAQTAFTDGNLQAVTLNPLSVTVTAGNNASYTANLTMGGNTTACTVTLSVTTALPSGAVATFSSPNPTTVTNINFSRNLTITSTLATPPGTYSFTVQALRGSNCQGSGNPTTSGTLVVQPAPVAPTTLTVQPATTTFGGTTTLAATLTKTSDSSTVSNKTVSFTLNGSSVGNAVTNANGVATLSNVSLSGINAGSYPNGVVTSFAGDSGFAASTGSASLTVGKAATVTTVSCGAGPFIYNGGPHTPCTASVSGPGLNEPLTVSYINNVNAGAATASASYSESANYLGSSDSKNFTIQTASSSTTVTCPANVTFTGSAIEPCTATVSGIGGLSQPVTVIYSNNINAGTATASATFAGDANHDGSSDSKTFEITKAATVTMVTCGAGPFTYNGSPHTPCTAKVTGPGGLDQALTVNYTNNVNAGTASASAAYAETANYLGSSDSKTFIIDKAASTTTVTCPASVIYNGVAQTPCSATVTGIGGLSQALTVTYTNNINAGTATASATFAGDANHNGSSDSKSFNIEKAASITVVTCPASVVYNGGAQTPCTAAVSGVGSLNQALTVNYSDNINAGTATASATFAGDANHNGSSDSKSFTIEKASSTTVVTFEPGPYMYRGTAFTASATVTGVGGLNQTLPVVYTGNCTQVTVADGCSATASFTGDTNHHGSNDSKSITITTAFALNGFFSPIGGSVETGNGGSYADPVRSFKLGSTIPVKFGASWLNGGSALITGIHTLQAMKYSNSTDYDPPIDATPTDAATDGNQFRLSSTDWHFNLSTKNPKFTAGTWLLVATLQDGSKHTVWISIKK